MPNGTYGGVRGRKSKVGRKLLRFPPTRFIRNKAPTFPSQSFVMSQIFCIFGHIVNKYVKVTI